MIVLLSADGFRKILAQLYGFFQNVIILFDLPFIENSASIDDNLSSIFLLRHYRFN